jgi:DNA polymerase-3 subunit beta
MPATAHIDGSVMVSLRVATDRYRMASAAPAAGGPVDALVPAPILAEMVKQAGRADRVAIHADAQTFGLAWPTGSIVVPTLGSPFPDTQLDGLLDVAAECALEVDTDAFAAALERAAPYGGPHGRVTLEARDGVVVVRASDALTGEAEETVKASVSGDRVTRSYQARLLAEALRPFARRTVLMRIQAGLRPTALTAIAAEDLHYLVVPMR